MRAPTALCLLLGVTAVAVTSALDLVIIGDSMSDTGNLISLLKAAANMSDAQIAASPYSVLFNSTLLKDGRCSDGPLWPEYFRNWTGARVRNYARIGANACLMEGPTSPAVQYNLSLAEASSGTKVIAFWMGVNDLQGRIVEAIKTANSSTQLTQLATTAVEEVIYCIRINLMTLVSAGEQRIMVFSAPALYLSEPSNENTELANFARRVIQGYNARLRQVVAEVNAMRNVRARYLDITTTMSRIATQFRGLGFVNNSAACLQTNNSEPDSLYPQALGPGATFVSLCPNSDQYVWYATFHFSSRANMLMTPTIIAEFMNAGWLQK